MNDLKTQLRKFIVDNFMFGTDNGFADGTSFLKEGIMDSTGALELITFLEETFGIAVEDEELLPENLDSIDNLCNYMNRKGIQATKAA
jgi:acyl carrier protein